MDGNTEAVRRALTGSHSVLVCGEHVHCALDSFLDKLRHALLDLGVEEVLRAERAQTVERHLISCQDFVHRDVKRWWQAF